MSGQTKNDSSQMFNWEDNDAGDFPFYKQARIAKPVFWIKLLVLFVVIVFALLAVDLNQDSILNSLMDVGIPKWLAAIPTLTLFPLLMFGTAWLLFRDETRGLFRKLKKSDAKVIVLCWLAYLVYSSLASVFLKLIGQTTVGDAAFGHTHGPEAIKNSVGILLQLPTQLFGEELFALFALLIFMTVAYGLFKLNRKTSLIIGLVASGFIFGMAHYKAYDWHLAQMLLIIGAGRIFLTFAYLKTKNILASFLVHVGVDGGALILGILVALLQHTS